MPINGRAIRNVYVATHSPNLTYRNYPTFSLSLATKHLLIMELILGFLFAAVFLNFFYGGLHFASGKVVLFKDAAAN